MAVTKSAQDAIEEFVEAIAQHYLAVQAKSRDGEDGSVAEEFVSAIETDLRSTLRDRLSRIETVKKVELTPTSELSAAGIERDLDDGDHDSSDLEATLDSALDIDAVTQARDTNRDDYDTPTLEVGPTPVDLDSDRVVRPGRKAEKVDLTYDDRPTLDSGNGPVRGASVQDHKRLAAPPGYEILRTLGKGGMGIVYQARHIPLNRIVAVKMIISGANASDDQISRFQREAEAAAHLKHPHIVSVYEVGLHKGLP